MIKLWGKVRRLGRWLQALFCVGLTPAEKEMRDALWEAHLRVIEGNAQAVAVGVVYPDEDCRFRTITKTTNLKSCSPGTWSPSARQ